MPDAEQTDPPTDYEAMPIIGWREWVGLPDLGIERVKAKIDTGARSSALHAMEIERLPKASGIDRIRFLTHPLRRGRGAPLECTAELLDVRTVRSSNGQLEDRFLIRTMVALMSTTWPIELTLTSRFDMRFRMLLGREAVRGRFLVDAGVSYLDPTRRKRQSKPAE